MNLNKNEFDNFLKNQNYTSAMKMLKDRQRLIDTYQNDELLFQRKHQNTLIMSAFKIVQNSEEVTESDHL
ncbi:hypothetical protein ENUP19_0082G0164 [Entamoeba nuttalli]|uniref:Uncharacterized protein n=1 Tax=Entamoeba nuttalli TaxID=412467 RepID=A0ABQ0DFJ2_9EUKA